jgi:hypothetical protein
MKYFGEGLSEIHKELNQIIRKEDKIERSKVLFLELHAKLHLSAVSNTKHNEVDGLLDDLTDNEYAIMPTVSDETIAWVIWHIARIEDLTMNMLVAKGNQVFNPQWQRKLNVSITDTGNALTDDEIISFSKSVNTKELLDYRSAVGKQSRAVVQQLKSDDMKRKIASEDIERIKLVGGVTNQEDSIWLLDFWGKKDVAGILLMPPTRHVMLHLNDCCKWKEFFRTKNRFYRS